MLKLTKKLSKPDEPDRKFVYMNRKTQLDIDFENIKKMDFKYFTFFGI